MISVFDKIIRLRELIFLLINHRLVIGIVVEQLKYDQLEKFRDRFGENGIKRLINEGTYFKNASFEYMLTQSAPGHATISTGTEPSSHGITSDNWYLPLKNELIYCTKDIEVNPVGGSYESGLHSPVNLQASTFSDELEMATNKKAKVFGVGIKGKFGNFLRRSCCRWRLLV